MYNRLMRAYSTKDFSLKAIKALSDTEETDAKISELILRVARAVGHHNSEAFPPSPVMDAGY